MTELNRRSVLTVGAALTALAVAGCGPNRPDPQGGETTSGGDGGGVPTGPLTATFWGNPAILESFQASLAAVTAADDTLTFDAQYSAYADYWEKLAVRTAGGNPPDLMEMHTSFLAEYATRGTLRDLSDVDLSYLSEAALTAVSVDGKVYGIPIGAQTQVLIVDQTFVEGVGGQMPDQAWTWDDFAAWTEQISAAGGDGVYGTEDVGGSAYALEVFMRQRGKNVFDQSGGAAIGFDVDDLVAMWQMWEQLRASGAAAPADVMAGTGAGLGESLMLTGKSAVRFDYTNNYVNATTLTEDALVLYGYPGDGDPASAGAYAQYAVSLSVSATTEFPDAVVSAIQLMLSDETSVTALGLTNGVPVLDSAKELLVASATEAQKIAIDRTTLVVDTFPTPPAVPPAASTALLGEYARQYQEVAYGRASVADGAQAFIDAAPGILSA